MLGFLAGVPGKLTTLLSRIGASTPTQLGYLTAEVAPKSTALSSATWTPQRAGYLDNLNVGGNVASAASLAALTLINRIQYATCSLSNGATLAQTTITAVVIAKTIIVPCGYRWDNTFQPDSIAAGDFVWSLVNTTTVQIQRGRDYGTLLAGCAFVVEFK